MRRIALIATVLLATTTSLAAQNRHRSGFWLETGSGPAAVRVGCAGCSDPTRSSGAAGYLRLGGVISDKVLVGIESYTFLDETFGFEDDDAIEAETSNLALAVIWFPGRSGFFLRGGLGVANGRFTVVPDGGDPVVASGTGVGMTFGLGYDVPLFKGIALTGGVGATLLAIGDLVLPGRRIEDVIPATYQLQLGITFR